MRSGIQTQEVRVRQRSKVNVTVWPDGDVPRSELTGNRIVEYLRRSRVRVDGNNIERAVHVKIARINALRSRRGARTNGAGNQPPERAITCHALKRRIFTSAGSDAGQRHRRQKEGKERKAKMTTQDDPPENLVTNEN